jgi:hypothetical protein
MLFWSRIGARAAPGASAVGWAYGVTRLVAMASLTFCGRKALSLQRRSKLFTA